jgi:glycosyltransferase involved in cell wall biosynthesis
VIADAQAIADHVQRMYGRTCTVIPYGAEVIDPGSDRLDELDLEPQGYHLIVARFEPENHVLDAVHAYRLSSETRRLVVVGSAPYSEWYVDKVRVAAGDDARIRFTGGIYDQGLLDQLYANCVDYIHGHSVGGTNPSLLRAMGAGAPVLAYDVEFNREVTADDAFFWADADALTPLLDEIARHEHDERLAELRVLGRQRIREAYQWDAVTDQYESLIKRLAARKRR